MSSEPENVQVPFQDLFASSLRHQLPALVEQVDTGLYALKRYAYYLQKMCLMKKPALTEMLKATEHEADKKTRVEKDRMQNHVAAYRRVQDVFFTMLTDESRFVTAVNETVAEPLLAWHKTAEKRRDALIKREQQLSKDLKDMHARVTSARSNAHKQWASLQAAHKDLLKLHDAVRTGRKGADKDVPPAEKRVEKERARTEQLFALLETTVTQGNAFQSTQWDKELPALVQDWEKLEVERLQMLGSHMAIFSRLQLQLVAPLPNCAASVAEDVAALDGKSEMRDFAAAALREYGPPMPPAAIPVQLPCSAATLQADDVALPALLAMELPAAVAMREQELANGGSGAGAGGSTGGRVSFATGQQAAMSPFGPGASDDDFSRINAVAPPPMRPPPPTNRPSVPPPVNTSYANNVPTGYAGSAGVSPSPPPLAAPGFAPGPSGSGGYSPAVVAPVPSLGTLPPPPRSAAASTSAIAAAAPPVGYPALPPQFGTRAGSTGGAGPPPLPNGFGAGAAPPPLPPSFAPVAPPVAPVVAAPAPAPEPQNEPEPAAAAPAAAESVSATASIPGFGTHGAVYYVRGVYDFASEDPEDAAFPAGSTLAVLDDTGASAGEGWLKGAIVAEDGSLGKVGTFPSNYIELIE